MTMETGMNTENIAPLMHQKVSRKLPFDNMHMIKANSATETKITTLDMIKPNNKRNKKVIKSLKEWAAKILCLDNDYSRPSKRRR